MVTACASPPRTPPIAPTPVVTNPVSTPSPGGSDSPKMGVLRVGQERTAVYVEGFISFLRVSDERAQVVVDRIYRFADNDGLLIAESLPPGDYTVRSWVEAPMDGTTPTGHPMDECTATTRVLTAETTNLQVRGQQDGSCMIMPQDHAIVGTKPEAYVLREPLESCGFAMSMEGWLPEEMPEVPPGFDCLIAALDDGRSAELLQITSEVGEEVSRVWRVLDDGAVEVFVERTTTGGDGVDWSRLTCTEIVVHDPPVAPTAEGCGPAEPLPLPDRPVVSGASSLVAVDPETGGRHHEIPIAGDRIGTPAVGDGVVYVSAATGDAPPALLAIDLNTGEEKWRWSAGQLYMWARPVPAGDVVIVGTLDGRVIGVDRSSGAQRWSYKVGHVFGGPPAAVTGDSVVVGAERPGTVAVLDLTTGGERWRVDDLGVGTQPAVTDGAVIAAVYDDSDAGRVIAWDLADGQQRWSVEIPRSLLNPPVVSGDLVLVGGARTSGDAAITAIDLSNGEPRWETPLPGTFVASLQVGQQVVAAANDGGIHALSTPDGSQLWTAQPGLTGDLTLVDELLLVELGDEVVAYGAVDGTQRWRVQSADRASPADQLVDGMIWIAEPEG